MIESSVVDKEEQHEHQDDGSHSSCSVERKESQEDHRAQEHGDDEDENLLENALALMSEQHGVDERTIDGAICSL